MQAVRSSAIRVLLAAVALLAAPASALYAPSSLLALRVGDGVYCPSAANASCTVAAPLYLDEYSLPSGALVSSVPVPGATLSSIDQYLGSLSRSADGTSLAFGANLAPAGMAPSMPIQSFVYTGVVFSSARVVVRVNSSGVIDTSTRLSATDYNGTIKGVCSMDGTGFWIAGTVLNACISYVGFGSAAGSGNVVSVAHDTTCSTSGSQNGFYFGCTAVASPNRLFFTRSFDSFAFIDQPAPPTQSALWTTPGGLNILGAVNPGGIWNKFGGDNLVYSQMLVNRAQTAFWVIDPEDWGIAYGTSIPDLPNMPLGTTCYLVGGGALGDYPFPSGIALSLDETIVS